jgi:hypothetical protein
MKIYLASQFSNSKFWVRWYRVYVATKCAAKLMRDGYVVFSPLTHSFFCALFMPKKLMCDFDFWMKQDLPFLEACDCLIIISHDIAQWKESKGVCKEYSRNNAINHPCYVFPPDQILDGCYKQILQDSSGNSILECNTN